MIAYEFYWRDPMKGWNLIGVLPERRKHPERIAQKSVMNWVEKVFGNQLSTKDIYFVQVRVYGEDLSAYPSFHNAEIGSKNRFIFAINGDADEEFPD